MIMNDENQESRRVSAPEIRQLVEKFERLEVERQEVMEQQREVMKEAKAHGYNTKILRRVVALRKRDPDAVSNEEALLRLYLDALEE